MWVIEYKNKTGEYQRVKDDWFEDAEPEYCSNTPMNPRPLDVCIARYNFYSHYGHFFKKAGWRFRNVDTEVILPAELI